MYEAVGFPGNLLSGSGPSARAAQEPFAPSGKGGYAAAEKEKIAAVKMVTGCSKSSTALIVESWNVHPIGIAVEVLAFTQ